MRPSRKHGRGKLAGPESRATGERSRPASTGTRKPASAAAPKSAAPKKAGDVLFFTAGPAWRRWLEKHHGTAKEVWVGFHKKGSGKSSITYQEAVDGALCFGWIDGVRKGIDATSYKNRFTPRRAGSNWSSTNVKRAEELSDAGLMHPAGLKAFRERKAARSGVYSYEQRKQAKLDPAYEAKLRANEKAWEYFRSKPPAYQQTAVWWIVSAKKEETRLRRLATLIEYSEQGRPIPPLAR